MKIKKFDYSNNFFYPQKVDYRYEQHVPSAQLYSATDLKLKFRTQEKPIYSAFDKQHYSHFKSNFDLQSRNLYSSKGKYSSLSHDRLGKTDAPFKDLMTKYIQEGEDDRKPRGYSYRSTERKITLDEQSTNLKKRLQAKIQEMKKRTKYQQPQVQHLQLTVKKEPQEKTVLQRLMSRVQKIINDYHRREQAWIREKKELQTKVETLRDQLRRLQS